MEKANKLNGKKMKKMDTLNHRLGKNMYNTEQNKKVTICSFDRTQTK